MDCPVCGTERTERSGGENLTVIECPSCRRLSLWWVGLLAVVGLPKDCMTLVGSWSRTTWVGVKRLGARTVAALSRRPAS